MNDLDNDEKCDAAHGGQGRAKKREDSACDGDIACDVDKDAALVPDYEGLSDEEFDARWDAACARGWHGVPWEDRHGEPPEPELLPLRYWPILIMVMAGILWPLFAWIWRLF